MEYPQLIGKTIKSAKSWNEEEGVTYLQLTFTDETSFSYATKPGIQSWAHTDDAEGEVVQAWE